MRFRSSRPQTGVTVLMAGWLFADLFLALMIVFLGSDTSGLRALAVQPAATAAARAYATAQARATAVVVASNATATANSVAIASANATATSEAIVAYTNATATAKAQPTPAPLPRLELTKHRITLLNMDATGLFANSPTAIAALQQQVNSQTFLQGRSVGLVIAYDGAPDSSQITTAQTIAQNVMKDLVGQPSFTRASYYDTPLYNLGDSASTVVIDVYLFA